MPVIPKWFMQYSICIKAESLHLHYTMIFFISNLLRWSAKAKLQKLCHCLKAKNEFNAIIHILSCNFLFLIVFFSLDFNLDL